MSSELEALGINLHGKTAGQVKTKCPKCGNAKHLYDLSVNITEGSYKCHRPSCDFTGYIKVQREIMHKKEYKIPAWQNNTNLSDKLVKWFKTRGISQRALQSMKITEGEEWMPQINGKTNTVQFNYFRGETLLNVKYRDAKKNFRLSAGAELLFYNENALMKDSIIICEGEIDALSFFEVELENAVSVPNGASQGKQNLEYLDAVWERLEKINTVYLATDNDLAGISLRNELSRRIGAEKCLIIDFKDCKDANEYLVKHGSIALGELINEAKPMPISGIITIDDISDDIDEYYHSEDERGKLLGFTELDRFISFEGGQKTIITGIPNHGKSEFLDQMLVLLSLRHGWKFGVFSPENLPLKMHFAKMCEKLIGKRFKGYNRMDESEKDMAKQYLRDYFYFICSESDDFTLEIVLEKAKQLIIRYGINALVIDPFNRMEHYQPVGMSETNYIGKLLDKMDRFCKLTGVHIFLVAHPTKVQKDKQTGLHDVPNLYSINGSANFFNKADIGMCVYRNFNTGNTEVHVQKVRFKTTGEQGLVQFQWNSVNGRYNEVGTEPHSYNYLIKSPDFKSNGHVRQLTSYSEVEPSETPF